MSTSVPHWFELIWHCMLHHMIKVKATLPTVTVTEWTVMQEAAKSSKKEAFNADIWIQRDKVQKQTWVQDCFS